MVDSIQRRSTRGNDKTYTDRTPRSTTITKILRGYGEPRENNIGVFQVSSISAILFVIYMGDMMEAYAAMGRRSKLPTRIAQDRPNEQAKQLL